jgi:hypothetical protein
VGDGNHSLAAAKAVWEEYKAAHRAAHRDEPALEQHPARWALAELENLYDPGLAFEPIHRLIFGFSAGEVLEALGALPDFSSRPVKDPAELTRLLEDPAAPRTRLGLVAGAECLLGETAAPAPLTGSLQPLLDALIRGGPARPRSPAAIDYIHGAGELCRLAAKDGGEEAPRVGLLLPPVKKSGFFETLARSGPLPRKSFSMGEAIEKRYYLECRRLFG